MILIKGGTRDVGIKIIFLGDVEFLFDMSKVPLDLAPVGETFGKVEILVAFFDPELVDRDFGVNPSTGIDVIAPNASKVLCALESMNFEA